MSSPECDERGVGSRRLDARGDAAPNCGEYTESDQETEDEPVERIATFHGEVQSDADEPRHEPREEQNDDADAPA